MIMQVKEGLYGFEIEKALCGLVDILSSDHVYDIHGPMLAVCNTSPSDTLGTHWVVVCIDSCRRGEFFDSLGMPPHTYGLERSMDNVKTWVYNDKKLQSDTSVVCGFYAIAFCRAKLLGIDMQTFVSLFSTRDYHGNDDLIYRNINV